MANIAKLLTEHIDIWTAAETEKKSGRGRASGNAGGVYGVKKLRELILELAVRGKLVPQDPNDEPASELLKRIQAEKAKLIAEDKFKKEKPLASISDDEKPFELPQSWEWVYFGEVAQHNSGKTLDKGRNKGVLRDYITTSNLYWGSFELDSVRQMPIEESELERCTAIKGDLLLCEGGEAGRAAVWELDKEVCFQNHIHRARMYGKISPYYAYRYFEKLNASGEVEQYRKGVGISNMSGKALASVVYALPPLTEQHRIVAKIDELMALCDQLEQQHSNAQEAHEALVSQLLATLMQSQNTTEFDFNWQRIYAHFDVLFITEASIDALKQTLLQLAVMGKLVPQDPNDEPVSELLKRIQAEKAKLITEGKLKKEKPLAAISEDEKLFELPKRWEWVRLSDVSTYIQYGYTDSANQINKEVLLLRITDIQDDFVDWATVPGCNSSLKQVKDYLLSENDIVIARTGGTIGKSYLVNNLTVSSIFASYLIRIGKVESINHKFKKLYFGSQLYWSQLYANSMGTGQPNVNGTALKGLIFSLPPIEEQQRIVAKVNALMALCDQLKTCIKQANQHQQVIADALVVQAVN